MKKLIGSVFLSGILIMTAGCGDHSTSAQSNKASANAESTKTAASKVNIDNSDSQNTSTTPTNSTDDNNSSSTASNDSTQNPASKSVKITSGSEAITYLKRQLKLDDTISYSNIGGELETDKKGPYYKIKVVDTSVRQQGGSGTLGLYKVYQSGSYSLIDPSTEQDETNESNPTPKSVHITSSSEAKQYLRKQLNDDGKTNIKLTTDGSLHKATNGYGAYYIVTVTDSSQQEDKKVYQVHEEGTVIPQ
ncbi:hypothetical protein JOD43_003565 [Pullulanibacillus pueri]|uniref:Lipoprotein n=1 Tax=Pullulanibacillus pueri TaxID=1437324 RepID=A0A8J2ZYD5_9BACL|nr:hypothetical protein [Pullulanibacillus pueri]MBM7683385.1 hypothetical protein [Pullulanibacillus pueri]GGH86527.1 hypothetical protein GCM10007096_34440 [Pullulanibacillus pueri]